MEICRVFQSLSQITFKVDHKFLMEIKVAETHRSLLDEVLNVGIILRYLEDKGVVKKERENITLSYTLFLGRPD